ncbi:hypothetical protein DP117_21335 [Brasilonema sp. UFV-L1]|nr:hypothetical protein [Brasilonema sp. UFV-L1]
MILRHRSDNFYFSEGQNQLALFVLTQNLKLLMLWVNIQYDKKLVSIKLSEDFSSQPLYKNFVNFILVNKKGGHYLPTTKTEEPNNQLLSAVTT